MQEMLDRQKHSVNITLIGLRNLQSSGLLPVRKPFVKLQVKSMLEPEEQHAHENKVVPPQESGSNPNFNVKFNFELQLPANEDFVPTMTCSVLDQVFLGMSQPVIGTFQIPIGSIMQEDK